MSKINGSSHHVDKKRLTFAYFSASPGGSFNWEKWQMWRGISEAAKQLDINLLYIAGEEFESQPQAVLYDLIDAHNVDGIIAWNSFVGPRTSKLDVQEFINRFIPLPVVSIELALDGCANILLDEKQAIRDLLAHLIGDHHYHKIGFLSQEKNHPSTSRQQAFEQIMDEYGLLDPRLIGSLDELDERGLIPGIDYQVLVAHADDEAVRTVDAFRKRGIRVPEDVAITGFNDGMDARGLIPPLTTIRLPFRKMGRKAVEILVEQSKEKNLPEPVIFPVHLVLRRSCGCVEPMAEKAWVDFLRGSVVSLREMLESKHQEIIDELSLGMGTPVESTANLWAEKFLDLYTNELFNHLASPHQGLLPSAFLLGMQSIMQQAVEEGANVSRWHEALTALRKLLHPYLNDEERVIAEELNQQARVLIGQSAVRAEINHNWRAMQRGDILREVESELLISFDFNDLLTVLVKGLSRLELSDLYLVLYDNPDQKDGWARLVLAYRPDKETWMYAQGIRFNARDILPEGWIPGENAYQLLIEDLHLGGEQIGYVLFHTGPPGDASMCFIYQALQIQLSSAVKGVRLRQKLQEALHQAEEANQLKSGFLSMVSHELRTPLNLIVGLSEMAMRQKGRSTRSTQETLRKYLEQIYVSGQHLDRLIRDVLDLASSQVGQMNLVCQPLDLQPVLSETADMGRQLSDQKNLQFNVDFAPGLPRVWGDKTRLKQVLLNLLSNAIKFTAHGEVRFSASQKDGEVLISVKDTGLGIAREEQEVIFDEFHQTNRSMVRGYGGIGLGLAITRRLVEMHGGRIWVESSGTEGGGSTFLFTLPVLNQSIEPKTEPIRSREGVVLVLSKEEGATHTLAEHLKKSGFTVEEQLITEDVDIVVSLVAAPPGAVILDLEPAAELGWMIIKNLKENPATQELPVLFYSLMEEQTIGTVLEMDYLTKPVGTDQLIRALKRHGLRSGVRGADQSILIIDDDPGILDLQSRMIESKLPGCRVLTAQNAHRGLDLMRKEPPDLLLLDLMMPETDGFTLLKMMQEDPALRNIPVIVLSAQVLSRYDIQRLNQGVAAVLSKGMFQPLEILSRVECVLSRNQKLGSEAQRLVYQAIGYINEHYKDPVSRPEIAKYLSINEQYLSRCFNKVMGIGPMAYLSRHRILQAKKLLERKNLSVTQVALEVGLSSQSYFSRIFQQEVGVTPSEYMHGKRAEKD